MDTIACVTAECSVARVAESAASAIREGRLSQFRYLGATQTAGLNNDLPKALLL